MNLAYESEERPAGLVGHVLHRDPETWPPPLRGAMFDYALAEDGLYLHALREELEVCFKIAPAHVRGLQSGPEIFHSPLPEVPENLVRDMLNISLYHAEESKETLFWLEWSALNPFDEGWLLTEPGQRRTGVSCRPFDGQEEAYNRVLIEIHSHHKMRTRFSTTDDKDETGFRVYGVIGDLPHYPMIRMRAGVYGAGFWEIPATWVLDLPEGLTDCNPEAEGEADESE